MTHVFSLLLYIILRILKRTCRFEVVNPSVIDREKQEGNTLIYAFWHQNIIASAVYTSDFNPVGLVSQSDDGDIVSMAVEKMGIKSIRGSSTRGGKEALLEMADLIRQGNPGVITVDGPAGPPHKAKKGVLMLAKKSEAKIVPLTCLSRKFWFSKKSWDQSRMPKPFSTVDIIFGEPLTVARELSRADLEIISGKLEKSLEEGEAQLIKRRTSS